jgi:diaminopimelate decarboxylase
MQEVELIRDVARRRADRPLRVGLRCNFPMPGLARSRFGIDADGDDLDRAAGLLRGCANVHFVGLHCHVGGDRSAASYAYRVARMIELADRLFPGAPPGIIDVGGGFAGPLPEAIAAQYRVTLPSYEEYADAVAGPMARRYGQAADGPTLVIEPGIGLLADVMEFVCEVAVLKDIGGQGHAVATGSVYEIKPFLGAVDLPLEVVAPARAAGPRRRWVVSGYTCMEIDVMHKGIEADLAVGDYFAFSNTGAYTVVLKPPFISPAPAIVALEDDGVVTVARRAEVLDDILRTYTGASA